ncbi:MAG TPA: MFS transporter, partial [Trebonia sp.]
MSGDTPAGGATARPEAATAGRRPALVLAVVLLATFAINVDTTIVNVALPAVSRQLHATTSGLQWVVDAYNLAFAALILAGGTVGDRYGRRWTLAAGLAVFAAGSAVAAEAGSTSALIGWRVLMGAAAAFIFPTTLSIISQTFPDRAARAKAIGAWGAAAGAAVALGPIAGGELLGHFWWGSIFWVMVPLAALTLAGTLAFVPADRRTPGEPLDLRGLGLSALGLASLVYTIIEAPDHGWSSSRTLAGFAVAAAALTALAVVEARAAHPMLDVRLFTDLRFTAASGAV